MNRNEQIKAKVKRQHGGNIFKIKEEKLDRTSNKKK